MKQYICDCCKQPMSYDDLNLKNLNWGGPIDSDSQDKQATFPISYVHGHKLAVRARVERYVDETRWQTTETHDVTDVCATCRWIAILKLAPAEHLAIIAGVRCAAIPNWQPAPKAEAPSPERDDPAPAD